MSVKVIILCGGQGTRLREETEYRPKPMVQIGEKPILWHLMKMFSHYGLNDFVLCLGYRGDMIKNYFLNYREMTNDFTICLGKSSGLLVHATSEQSEEFKVTLVDTGLDTMTGARVKKASRHIDSDIFMVAYGDTLSDVNIGELIKFHRSHKKLATITVTHPVSRFGMVDMTGTGQVERFVEEPKEAGWASAGFMVLSREALDYIDNDPACILEKEPLENLTAEGQLVAYQHEGFFYAMETYREYLK